MWQPSCQNLGEEFFFRKKLWLIYGNGTNEIKGKKKMWQLICGMALPK